MRFTPATADTVAAAREAVTAAANVRAAECAKRGHHCRARESDETTARATLAKAISDKAATDQAARIDTAVATVRTRLATAPATASADPGAAALANYLGLFGLSVPAALLGEAMVLVGVVALELGSSLSVVLVGAFGGHRTARVLTYQTALNVPEPGVRPSDRPQTALPDTKPTGNTDGDGPRGGRKAKRMPATKRTRAKARRLGSVVRLVAKNGGQLAGSQRDLAKRLGLGKSRTHELLREAAAAGLLAVETSKLGTRVALAG
jgi:hypothetical protein